MPWADNTKIMLGWVGVWVSGGLSFYGLQKHVEAGRKERMRTRRLKRRERERKKREKEELEAAAAKQQLYTESVL